MHIAMPDWQLKAIDCMVQVTSVAVTYMCHLITAVVLLRDTLVGVNVLSYNSHI